MILSVNTNGTLIDEDWADFFAAGRPRRYYHLTDAGRRRLCEKEAEWRAYTTAVARVLKGGA